jgi:3-methyladenine DNA glycosylase AlkC
MPDKLKDFFDERIVARIATDLAAGLPELDRAAFVAECLAGFPPLELVDRARHVATVLHRHLPEEYERAIEILTSKLGPPLEQTEGNGMEPFLYLPHIIYVAVYGLEHFDASMRAQYELTQRFSAEYSIRFFVERYPETTYQRLLSWASDPSVHVRRLVSEGTRPRLPWAPRLRAFQADPRPVIELLERLRDDPELYVRRSVANNLNDIGKDHPDLLVEICRAWSVDASAERRWVVRHALRSLVKQGHPGALAVLGYGEAGHVAVEAIDLPTAPVPLGSKLAFACDLVNSGADELELLVDYRVHFVKANGKTSPKVFKLRSFTLAAGQRARLSAAVSLADMTTRRHYAGRHAIALLVNGAAFPLGEVEVVGG